MITAQGNTCASLTVFIEALQYDWALIEDVFDVVLQIKDDAAIYEQLRHLVLHAPTAILANVRSPVLTAQLAMLAKQKLATGHSLYQATHVPDETYGRTPLTACKRKPRMSTSAHTP